MKIGNFSENCPHCSEKLAVYNTFVDHDYANGFYFDCGKCGKRIECIVHAVPEFELFKPRCQRCDKQLSEKRMHEPYCARCFRLIDVAHQEMSKSMKGTA